jgi:rubrerythrin
MTTTDEKKCDCNKQIEKRCICGTQTERNIADAYIAESTAFSRYTYFAKQAFKESFFYYSDLITQTAANELSHGKVFLKYLSEQNVMSSPAMIDAGKIGNTLYNLKVASNEEMHEGVEQYAKAAETADKEGFPEIAERFRAIASVEAHHKERFDCMIARIEDDSVWKRDTPIKWQCLVCGYIHEGVEPPAKCPACDHPYQHFRPLGDCI